VFLPIPGEFKKSMVSKTFLNFHATPWSEPRYGQYMKNFDEEDRVFELLLVGVASHLSAQGRSEE